MVFSEIKKMSTKIKTLQNVVVIHHYDADGLSSGAILIKALEREGKKVSSLCLKQLYKENIDQIKSLGNNFVFVDFGSGQMDYLVKELGEENIFIIDHHQPVLVNNSIIPLEHHLNPLLFGIDGGKEISGAGLAYLVAKEMNPKNIDLSPLAIVGAVGDMQEFSGALIGLNSKILEEAISAGLVEKKIDLRLYGRISRPLIQYLCFSSSPIIPELTAEQENCVSFLQGLGLPLKDPLTEQWLSYEDLSDTQKKKLSSALIIHLSKHNFPEWKIKEMIGEVYTILGEEKKSPLRDAKEFATALNSSGRHARPEIGLKVCLGDRNMDGAYGELLGLIQEHRTALAKGIQFVTEHGVEEKKNFYFFDAGTEIQDSLVGIIAGMLYGSVIKEDKPIIALARNTDGTIKVSGRATSALLRKGINLGAAFKEISKKISGVEGGGHCLHKNTLVQKKCGEICKISEILENDYLLSRKNNFLTNSKCNKVFNSKRKKMISLKTKNTQIISSEDHLFFKYKNLGLVETKAKNLNKKDFILGVKKIDFEGKQISLINNQNIYLNLNKEIAWIIGYIQGKGNIGKKRAQKVLEKIQKSISTNFSPKPTLMRTFKKTKMPPTDLGVFFENIFPESKLLNSELKVPKKIMQSKNKILSNYIKGLFDAKASVYNRFITVRMVDEEFLKTIQLLLLRFGIKSNFRSVTEKSGYLKPSFVLYITEFDSLKLFQKEIGFTKNTKKAILLKNNLLKQSKNKKNLGLFSPITFGEIMDFVNENNITNLFNKNFLFNQPNSKRINYFTLNKYFIEPILRNKNKLNKKTLTKINWLKGVVNSKNLTFFEIQEKIDLGSETGLIDLSLPQTKNFFANGLIVHNSIAAGCKVPDEKLDEFLEILEQKLEQQLKKPK